MPGHRLERRTIGDDLDGRFEATAEDVNCFTDSSSFDAVNRERRTEQKLPFHALRRQRLTNNPSQANGTAALVATLSGLALPERGAS